MRGIRRWLVLSLSLAAACGSKTSAPAASPPIDSKAADALWALAPAKTVVGIVFADGSAATGHAGLTELVRVMGAAKGGDAIVAEMRAEMAGELPFDPLDQTAWQRAGIDLGRGAAAFIDFDNTNTLLVLPVGDRAAFRAITKAKVESIDGREVDQLDDMKCTEAGQRYLCALDLAVIDAAVAKHDSPLAARAGKLAPELRGNIELIAELGAIPPAQQELSDLAPALTDIGALAVGVRLGGGAATLRFWLEGKRGQPIGAAIGEPAADGALLALGGAGAASAFRMRLPMELLIAQSGAPSSLPIPGGVDLRTDLLDQLAGDVALYAVGRSPLAGVMALSIKDPARVGKAVKGLCGALVDKAPPGVKVEPSDAGCAVHVDLESLVPAEVKQLFTLPRDFASLDGSVSVRDKLLVVSVGDVPTPSGELGAAAGSPGGREILTGAWHAVMWARSLDPLAGAGDELGGLFDRLLLQAPEGEEGLARFRFGRWLLAHVYEVGAAAALRDDGVHGLVQITTFAADPPEVYQAYEAAVRKQLDGDGAGYRAALAELAAKSSGTLAGRQAALVAAGSPVIAGSTGILAAVAIPAFMKYIKKSKGMEAQQNVHKLYDGARTLLTDAPSGAGFGSGLPTAVGPTPPLGTCCQGDKGGCAPHAEWWTDGAWVSLRFSMDDPHFYSYQFNSHADADGLTFTARAFGDLDCDGVYSTFEMGGKRGPNGEVVSTGIYREKELE